MLRNLILSIAAALLFTSSAFAERVRLLQDNSEALQARVDIIGNAKKEIYAEYFSVWNDEQSVGGLSLLMDAARKGVKVKIIMDALSNTVPNELFAALLANGKDLQGNQNLEIKVYNAPSLLHLGRIMHRDHAKMLIADGERLITGGRNVGDKYFGLNGKRNFRDLDILTEGKVAQEAAANFMAVWNSKLATVPSLGRFSLDRLETDSCQYVENQDDCERTRLSNIKDFNREVTRIETTLSDISSKSPGIHIKAATQHDWLEGAENAEKVLFLSHVPHKIVREDSNIMSDRLMKLALRAKKDLNILSPYLIPTEGMIKIFQRLLDRGVRIRIITNSLKSTDNLAAQAGYKGSKMQLIKMGIEIYEYNGPETTHAKVAVIDDKISIVGTYNLDPRSDNLNREVGVAVMDTPNDELATTLTNAIEDFRSNSTLVGKDGLPVNQEKWDEGVEKKKLRLLKMIMTFLPFFRNQI